jgi:predicted hotdog family 3-hydroxylacyl-ACP dehydratase
MRLTGVLTKGSVRSFVGNQQKRGFGAFDMSVSTAEEASTGKQSVLRRSVELKQAA